MKITIQPVHVKVDINFEEIITQKFAKLEKFFFDEPSVRLIIKKERFLYVIEADVKSKSGSLFVKESSHDLMNCLEILVDKLKNKLSKLHEKKIDLSHKAHISTKEIA